MKEVRLYVWWSAGKCDGDGYESSMDVSDEEYEALREYESAELDEVDDPLVKDLCQEAYDTEIDALIQNSAECFEEDGMVCDEGYLIYAEDGDEFWQREDRDEEEDLDYEFVINIANGGDSTLAWHLTREEKELIYKAIENGEEFIEVPQLKELYNKVYEAAKEKLQDDLCETDQLDEIDAGDLDYGIDFVDLPYYQPRYRYDSYEDYFRDMYSYGVRIDENFDGGIDEAEKERLKNVISEFRKRYNMDK